MRILFAAPHRDLLASYKAILEETRGETTTAFDGTQVMTLLENESFDLVILDQNLPRVPYMRLLQTFREKNLPVILLADNAPSSSEEITPSAFLAYPFTPSELQTLITEVTNHE